MSRYYTRKRSKTMQINGYYFLAISCVSCVTHSTLEYFISITTQSHGVMLTAPFLLCIFKTIIESHNFSYSLSFTQTLPYILSCSLSNSWPAFSLILVTWIYIYIHLVSGIYIFLTITCSVYMEAHQLAIQ